MVTRQEARDDEDLARFGGRDNGMEALEQYTETKTIWITLR